MGWYQAGSATAVPTWTKRLAITVDNSAASASGDVDVVIPPGLDEFWSTIDSSGVELRVTNAAGTLLAYSVDDGSGGAFSKTNKLGRIRIDAMTLAAVASVQLVWLYFGSVSAQGTAAVATAIAAAKTGYIETATPGPRRGEYQPPTPGLTRPPTVYHKRSTESEYLWFELTRTLSKSHVARFGTGYHEEPWYASMSVVNNAGADQAAMYSVGNNRFVWSQQDGRIFLATYVTGGTTATNYTAAPAVSTVRPGDTALFRTFVPTIGIAVRDANL